MGTVFRKSMARPLPAGAERFEKSRKLTGADRAANPNRREVAERFRLWTDKRGKLWTAPITIRDGVRDGNRVTVLDRNSPRARPVD